MQFTESIWVNVAIVILGFGGFLVARHVRKHKVADKPLVCMVGFDCHGVVHSDYSKFLGIPVEVLGMIYYAAISLIYLISIFGVFTSTFMNWVAVLSFAAFLFSLYLIGIQIFALKKGCSWCILSALISAAIFVLTVVKTL